MRTRQETIVFIYESRLFNNESIIHYM